MLSATRHHSHDSAKRSFIYYYSKDAQDESLKRNAEQVEEARLYLSSFEKRKLKERFGETIFDYTHLLTISLDFVEIDLYPSKEREELLFDDYSSPSSPLFFFSRVPWPQSRSNLYTDDCQKQGKHGTRVEIELKSNGRRINESTNRCIRNAITEYKTSECFSRRINSFFPRIFIVSIDPK